MSITIDEVHAQCLKIIAQLENTGQMSTDIELLKQDIKHKVCLADLEKSLGTLRTKIAVMMVISNIILATMTAFVVKSFT